ncbi:putative aldouronate transport system substrate-binding protein [Bacillus pakistanensis]|uniref:Aldouronate transport system substrate-binding protein n=1 Tax=Rossellomorea pakistanensis TaxID=992288 RepID=A0ABS2NDR2_9BACI|nr:extracellular solute-binding protein [Bacillus pakistanensis]MBM7585953.1 putative aldouronate transport system substrate-binding protein [Bacillus pakistanensis]
MFGKKYGRKYLAGIVAGALFSSLLLSGCSDEETSKKVEKNLDNVNKTGMPIVKEKVEIDAFGAKFFASQDWDDLMLWNKYEEMTNIDVNWETVQIQSLEEKRNLMLASGDYPDMIFAAAFSRSDIAKYGKQGVFLPLNDLIDEYAPNLKKLMEKYPVIEQGITMADGNIYSLPAFYDPEFIGLSTGTSWIKSEWLDKLGLEEPKTLDEFYNVLKAFKEQDPNGNGKADEIPWGGGYGIDPLINELGGAFGINSRGTSNKHIDLDIETDEVRFEPTSDDYKELLQYLNKLYKDGLINQDIFTTEPHEFNAAAGSGNYGVLSSIDPKTLLGLDGYVGIPVLAGEDGKQLLTGVGSRLGNIGMFVMTDKNENPAATLRWMDHFYGDEGSKMFFMGFEGVTFEEKDGEFVYTEEITNNPDGLNLDQAISKYLTWPGGYYPGFVQKKYFQGAEAKDAQTANSEKALPHTLSQDKIWPAFNFTIEEQDQISTMSTDIDTFVEESTAAFITGDKSFSEWDQYVETLEKMGLKDYLKIYQAAYERYKEQK